MSLDICMYMTNEQSESLIVERALLRNGSDAQIAEEEASGNDIGYLEWLKEENTCVRFVGMSGFRAVTEEPDHIHLNCGSSFYTNTLKPLLEAHAIKHDVY